MPREKCNACGRFINNTEGVSCSKCSLHFHKKCVNIPLDATPATGWLCPGCKARTPRKDNTDNPVRGENAAYVGTPQQSAAPCSTCSELLTEMKLMNSNMISFKNDFNKMKDDVSMLRGAIESFGGRLDCLESRITSLEKNSSEVQTGDTANTRQEVNGLLTTIEELKVQLNDREQESLGNDFEISGVPEEPGESAVHIVARIAEKLGVTYDERDLVFTERAGVKRTFPGGAGAGLQAEAPRPRPLVVRLTRRSVRDAFLQAARVRRSLTTEGLGLKAVSNRFYLNERLSKKNKMLFFKMRTKARECGWKYAWSREGRLYVRRETGRAAFRVRSEQDLDKIFGGAGDSGGRRQAVDTNVP